MKPTIKTLATDWLEIACTGKIEIDHSQEYTEVSKDVVITPAKGRSYNFDKIAKVYYQGREFATLQYDTSNPVIDPLQVMLRIHNELHYEVDKIDQLKIVLSQLNLKYKNISRLDVAGDGLNLLAPCQKMDEGKIKRVGSGISMCYKKSDGSIKQIQIGKRNSRRCMVGYNKSDELGVSGKGYIKEFWIKSGVEGEDLDNMERIELRMKNLYLKEFGKKVYHQDGRLLRNDLYFPANKFDSLYQLEDVDFLRRLYLTGLKGMYEFIRKPKNAQKRHNVTEQKRIYQLSMDWAKMELLPKLKAIASKQLKTMKVVTKQIYLAYKATSGLHYLKMALEMANVNDLELWMRSKIQHWDNEHKLKSRNPRHGWISNLIEYKNNHQLKEYHLYDKI